MFAIVFSHASWGLFVHCVDAEVFIVVLLCFRILQSSQIQYTMLLRSSLCQVCCEEAMDRVWGGRHDYPRLQLQHDGQGQVLRGPLRLYQVRLTGNFALLNNASLEAHSCASSCAHC